MLRKFNQRLSSSRSFFYGFYIVNFASNTTNTTAIMFSVFFFFLNSRLFNFLLSIHCSVQIQQPLSIFQQIDARTRQEKSENRNIWWIQLPSKNENKNHASFNRWNGTCRESSIFHNNVLIMFPALNFQFFSVFFSISLHFFSLFWFCPCIVLCIPILCSMHTPVVICVCSNSFHSFLTKKCTLFFSKFLDCSLGSFVCFFFFAFQSYFSLLLLFTAI